MTNNNQYQCSMCHGVFDKEWSDEEAKAEHDRDFPGASIKYTYAVCDDCYQKVRPGKQTEEMSRKDRQSIMYGYWKDENNGNTTQA